MLKCGKSQWGWHAWNYIAFCSVIIPDLSPVNKVLSCMYLNEVTGEVSQCIYPTSSPSSWARTTDVKDTTPIATMSTSTTLPSYHEQYTETHLVRRRKRWAEDGVIGKWSETKLSSMMSHVHHHLVKEMNGIIFCSRICMSGGRSDDRTKGIIARRRVSAGIDMRRGAGLGVRRKCSDVMRDTSWSMTGKWTSRKVLRDLQSGWRWRTYELIAR